MPCRDEIVEEVRAARDAFAARFNYDPDGIFDYLKAKEQEQPERLAKIKPVEPKLPVIARQIGIFISRVQETKLLPVAPKKALPRRDQTAELIGFPCR